MTEMTKTIPLDAGLIGELVTEIKVSSRTVGAYPKDHPAVQNSLNRVYTILQDIFYLRPGITLAIGKDTFVIDTHTLEKDHLCRQLARHLRGLGVTYIHFSPGLTLDELYNFHRFISIQRRDLSGEEIRETLCNFNLSHINIGFLDYEAFSFEEGKTATEIPQEDLWETYIVGILNGTLRIEELSEEIGDVPLDTFAHLLGILEKRGIDRTSSQEIVSLYVRKFLQKPFSNKEIKKLLVFIKELPSNLQEQFLSAVIATLSKDILITSRVFKNISTELIMELFDAIQSEKIDIPENLRNLLDLVLNFKPQIVDQRTIGDNLLVDDIFLPSDIADILSRGDAEKALSDSIETSVSDEYQKEIKQILESNASEMVSISLPDLKREIDDDFIEKTFNHVILEIMSSDLISQTEYLQFIENLKEQTTQFIVTGQYKQILRIKKLLQLNVEKNRFADITSETLQYYSTPEFFRAFIDSLRIMGRQSRDEAWQLCEDYGEMIISFLMNALINEETQGFRSLLMSLIRQFGDAIAPEALQLLNDSRWFVKRNMLYLLNGCKNEKIIPSVRPCCRHENPKVSFEAIKCLLCLDDNYGLERIREYLHTGTKAEIEQAITLLSAYKVKEAVPDLVQMLRKKSKNKSDLSQKIAIIEALGNIGDLRSLDAFREILFRKTFFLFKGGLESLKVEIYRTLKNYPHKEIEDIVQKGLKSRNEHIKHESFLLTKIREQ
jgi:hypothetical protein